MSEISCITNSEEATHALAAALARQCVVGDCIVLQGDLGTGKTTFARGFIRAVQAGEEEVVSPTFTLLQTYSTQAGHMVWHFDLYRLQSAQEVREIGLEEALQSGVTLVEWPQLAQEFLPDHALSVRIDYGNDSTIRRWMFCGQGALWGERLEKMRDAS